MRLVGTDGGNGSNTVARTGVIRCGQRSMVKQPCCRRGDRIPIWINDTGTPVAMAVQATPTT
eukprot:14268572-Heterocapsa_arctica.AAC.1